MIKELGWIPVNEETARRPNTEELTEKVNELVRATNQMHKAIDSLKKENMLKQNRINELESRIKRIDDRTAPNPFPVFGSRRTT